MFPEYQNCANDVLTTYTKPCTDLQRMLKIRCSLFPEKKTSKGRAPAN